MVILEPADRWVLLTLTGDSLHNYIPQNVKIFHSGKLIIKYTIPLHPHPHTHPLLYISSQYMFTPYFITFAIFIVHYCMCFYHFYFNCFHYLLIYFNVYFSTWFIIVNFHQLYSVHIMFYLYLCSLSVMLGLHILSNLYIVYSFDCFLL